MRKKFFILLTAITIVANALTFSVYATDELATDEIVTETTETPTEITLDTTTEVTTTVTTEEIFMDTVSAEDFENLQLQIAEMKQIFEENGYGIDDLNGDVDGINGEIAGLQVSLTDLYNLISSYQSTPVSNNTSSGGSSGGYTPKVTSPTTETPVVITTTTTTEPVEPNNEPNGFLVESVQKVSDERDFITVSTRDGHVFYIVIEYDGKENNKKVYFLNTVDTADLNKLMQVEGSNGSSVSSQPIVIPETKETTATSVNYEEVDDTKKNNTMLYIIGGIGIVVFMFLAKKKLKKKKSDFDDDEESSDDYTEDQETYVDEDKENDLNE